jgi:hypothetical protein
VCVEAANLADPAPGEIRLMVEAVGIHAVVRMRTSGKHYSCKELPHVPGVDGVGRTESGERLYFINMGGTLTEQINVPKAMTTPLPPGSDPVQVAAMVNPGLAAWMPFTARASNCRPGSRRSSWEPPRRQANSQSHSREPWVLSTSLAWPATERRWRRLACGRDHRCGGRPEADGLQRPH